MSLIGTLEQMSLPLVLQRIESFSKTGLLIIRQEARWVELYFRDGRLMCIGPVPAHAALGDRLLRAAMVSPQMLQEAIVATGLVQPGETRLALTLMDLGYVSHEGLRAWAAEEASSVLQVLLTWQNGELYFEEGQQPPSDRLLVALSPAALLPPMPPVPSAHVPAYPHSVPSDVSPLDIQQQQRRNPPTPPPGSLSVAELIGEPAVSETTSGVSFSLSTLEAPVSTGGLFNSSETSLPPLTPPRRAMHLQPPIRVDISSMRPEMVLLPANSLASLRQQNPLLQVTPAQWRLLSRIDGRTPLQSICQEFAMAPELVCQAAGELLALGIIQLSHPLSQPPMYPASHDVMPSSPGNHYTAMPPQPWSAANPTTEAHPPVLHTESQWGNGGNGATFMPGHGWVAHPQPPVQPNSLSYSNNNVYAQAGMRH